MLPHKLNKHFFHFPIYIYLYQMVSFYFFEVNDPVLKG